MVKMYLGTPVWHDGFTVDFICFFFNLCICDTFSNININFGMHIPNLSISSRIGMGWDGDGDD